MEPHAAQDRLSFVCNWKHMHSEAESKTEPPQLTSTRPPLPPSTLPFLYWVGGATVWSGPSGRPQGRVWEPLLNQTTWRYVSNSVQCDDCIVCRGSRAVRLKYEWQSRVCWGTRPWHWHKQNCTVHQPRSVTGQAGGGAGQRDQQRLHHCFAPEQDCIRRACMILINLISNVNTTRLSVMYVRNQPVISRGRETVVNVVQGLSVRPQPGFFFFFFYF